MLTPLAAYAAAVTSLGYVAWLLGHSMVWW